MASPPLNERLRRLLVVGGNGITGSAVVEAGRLGNWAVTSASRKPMRHGGDGTHLVLDLLDPRGTAATLAGAAPFDAVAYCAFIPGDDALNVSALANLLDGLAAGGNVPSRFLLLGGGKAYGDPPGPYRTPARESDPRIMGPVFYDLQQDLLADWSRDRPTEWTILRPDLVAGPSIGSPMNILTAIAAFAAVSRELGVALRFPGSPATWERLVQMTDADLFGRAAIWALDSGKATGEVFNVINGDQFRWKYLWPEIAAFFDMPYDEPYPMNLAERMADKGPVWDRIVDRYGLVPTPWDEIAAWPFADFVLNVQHDFVQSTIKIRRAGFVDCIDTHESVTGQLTRLRQMRLIP